MESENVCRFYVDIDFRWFNSEVGFLTSLDNFFKYGMKFLESFCSKVYVVCELADVAFQNEIPKNFVRQFVLKSVHPQQSHWTRFEAKCTLSCPNT